MPDTLANEGALARHRAPARHDSAFFGGMAVLLAITAFAAFTPPLRPGSQLTELPPLSPFLAVHAALFFAWILFYPSQVLLIAKGAVGWHRTLGVAGAVLAASMAVTATVVQMERTRRVVTDGSYAQNPIVEGLGLGLGMLDVAVFVAFVSAAIWLRHRPDPHKRLMLFATVAIIGPAMVRFPAITSLPPVAVVMSPLIFVVPLIAYDVLTRGRPNRATVWGSVISVAYHVLAMVLAGSGVTGGAARWISGVAK
jgi:hypothetical protein